MNNSTNEVSQCNAEINGVSEQVLGSLYGLMFGSYATGFCHGGILGTAIASMTNSTTTSMKGNEELTKASLQTPVVKSLIGEARSLGTAVDISDECVAIRYGAMRDLFFFGQEKLMRLTHELFDQSKTRRSTLYRKDTWETLKEPTNEFFTHDLPLQQINEQNFWETLNLLYRAFTVLGGKVVERLNGDHEFHLTAPDSVQTWICTPYDVSSLRVLVDLTQTKLILHDIAVGCFEKSTALRNLERRMQAVKWPYELTASEIQCMVNAVPTNSPLHGYTDLRFVRLSYNTDCLMLLFDLLNLEETGVIKTDNEDLHENCEVVKNFVRKNCH